jgi:hypothetical protein
MPSGCLPALSDAAALFMSPRGNESNTIAEIIPFIAIVQSLPTLFAGR